MIAWPQTISRRLIARLAAEPDLGVLAQPGAVVFVWDGAADRLLWASPAAQGLREALTDRGRPGDAGLPGAGPPEGPCSRRCAA